MDETQAIDDLCETQAIPGDSYCQETEEAHIPVLTITSGWVVSPVLTITIGWVVSLLLTITIGWVVSR